MEFLIRAAFIVDSNSPHHSTQQDLLIRDGKIVDIQSQIPFEGKIIEANGLRVSPGWFDMRADFSDPGNEQKEDLTSGTATAAAGGFTDVLLLPNTEPVTSSKNAVSYFLKWNMHSAVTLHPAAAVTLGCEGKELTEMIDLHASGAAAFTDGIHPIWHTDILLKGLQYLQKFDGLLINRPEDKMLTAFGSMHEGVVSTQLGLKGMPAIAEEIMIKRDLQLLEYAGGKIHFSLVSTKGSVELIREAKQKGLNITADVGIHHLLFDEDQLHEYDTSFKVNPPFRTKEDKGALIAAVKDGTIDVIVSDHRPHDEEAKKLEFDLADFGVPGLQSFYHGLLAAFGEETDTLLSRVTSSPRKLLGLENPKVEKGANAQLTLYTPEGTWDLNKENNLSKSESSPFWNQTLNGQVIGIVNNGQLVENQ